MGLIGVLSKYFKGVMAVTLIYLVLTGVVGGLRLAFIGQSLPFQQLWDYGGFTAMSIIHKLFATLYYIVNIRTAIQIGDPKFYTKVSLPILSVRSTLYFDILHCQNLTSLCYLPIHPLSPKLRNHGFNCTARATTLE